jgi:tyrosinase
MKLSIREAGYLYALALSTTFLPRICQAYAITGVSAGVNPDTGERPFRLNLKDFQYSGPPFDLYIQALSRFQADDQSNLLSYYEVAGAFCVPRCTLLIDSSLFRLVEICVC